ncbi:hypothetical protein BJF79_12230 [Actinomadura sp. CNU-125]|uniref:hypothetical protein n=1 Tax=Actinomadura sp. CNU-125 TaxID=1904961 RepID=UPI0009645A53|nr:hypothetical protein [Actinomadura sp. CNU-125]OLT26462.1 hypothetical protein BJF79_12230 [Actinomadura sp. CNU-125]
MRREPLQVVHDQQHPGLDAVADARLEPEHGVADAERREHLVGDPHRLADGAAHGQPALHQLGRGALAGPRRSGDQQPDGPLPRQPRPHRLPNRPRELRLPHQLVTLVPRAPWVARTTLVTEIARVVPVAGPVGRAGARGLGSRGSAPRGVGLRGFGGAGGREQPVAQGVEDAAGGEQPPDVGLERADGYAVARGHRGARQALHGAGDTDRHVEPGAGGVGLARDEGEREPVAHVVPPGVDGEVGAQGVQPVPQVRVPVGAEEHGQLGGDGRDLGREQQPGERVVGSLRGAEDAADPLVRGLEALAGPAEVRDGPGQLRQDGEFLVRQARRPGVLQQRLRDGQVALAQGGVGGAAVEHADQRAAAPLDRFEAVEHVQSGARQVEHDGAQRGVVPGGFGEPQARRPPPARLREPGEGVADAGFGRGHEVRQHLVVDVAARAAAQRRRAEQEGEQRPQFGPGRRGALVVEVAVAARQVGDARVVVERDGPGAQFAVQPVRDAPGPVRVHVEHGLLGEQHFEMVRQPGGTHLWVLLLRERAGTSSQHPTTP